MPKYKVGDEVKFYWKGQTDPKKGVVVSVHTRILFFKKKVPTYDIVTYKKGARYSGVKEQMIISSPYK